jgi:hypothetical protein
MKGRQALMMGKTAQMAGKGAIGVWPIFSAKPCRLLLSVPGAGADVRKKNIPCGLFQDTEERLYQKADGSKNQGRNKLKPSMVGAGNPSATD